jgi:anaerobic selenocysteine-containing dehydrogenase
VTRLERALDDAPPELQLINRRHLRDNNSWLHNVPRLVSGANRCTLLMHPDDAAARGLTSGGEVRVRSRVGEVVVPLEVTDQVMRGVVSLPHGYGHGREGVRLTVATAHAGQSVNDLSDELAVDAVSGNAAFNGLPVTVCADQPSGQL